MTVRQWLSLACAVWIALAPDTEHATCDGALLLHAAPAYRQRHKTHTRRAYRIAPRQKKTGKKHSSKRKRSRYAQYLRVASSEASSIRSATILSDTLLVPGIIYRKLDVLLTDSAHAIVHTLTCVLRNPSYTMELLPVRNVPQSQLLCQLGRQLDSMSGKKVLVALGGSQLSNGGLQRQQWLSSGEVVAAGDEPCYTLWLDRRHRVWLDSQRLSISLQLRDGRTVPIAAVNGVLSDSVALLFNRFAGDSIPPAIGARSDSLTRAQRSTLLPQRKLLLRYLRSPAVNEPVPCLVLGRVDSGSVEIPLRGCVVSYPSPYGIRAEEGDTVVLRYQLPTRDSLVLPFAISGSMLLVRSGSIVPSPAERVRRSAAAAGTDLIQSVLYLAVVERSAQSVGMTPRELAEFLKRFGAYHALQLDGSDWPCLWIGGRCYVAHDRIPHLDGQALVLTVRKGVR